VNISPAAFEDLARIVSDQSSIVLDPSRDYVIENRLTPLLFEQGMNSLEDLTVALRRDRFSPLHRKVIDALTNNETWFFRDGYPFDALREIVLPDLMERLGSQRTLRIWSAGSSSGQEIYSIAMLLCEHFPRLLGWELYLLGTDISDRALARALSGRYSQWEVNRGLPPGLLAKYFSPLGCEWQLCQTIRQMISFRFLNLSEPWLARQPFDVVFLRNVLIYLSAESRKAIFRKMHQALRASGYLFLGSAETTLNIDDTYDRIPYNDSFYYRPR